MSLRRIILRWKDIEGAHFGKTGSFSKYDIAIKSRFLGDNWSGVPYE